jgi:hypothetical protein
VAWGNALLGTQPIAPAVAACVVPFGAAMLALEALRKWLARRRLLRRAAQGAAHGTACSRLDHRLREPRTWPEPRALGRSSCAFMTR